MGSSPANTLSPKPPAALATPGQPHKQLPLTFSAGAAHTASAKHEPAALLQPPQEGSSWLAANLPSKKELQEWLKQVEAWVEAQTDDNFINRIRRAAVIWGVPRAR